MSDRTSILAARFRSAIQREEQAARQAAEEARRAAEVEDRRRAAWEAAHDTLLSELAELGELLELGVARDAVLTLSRGEATLVFAPGAGERVDVRFADAAAEDHVFLEDGTWFVSLSRAVLPLYDEGIEELVVRALGLPRPEPAAAPVAPPTPAAPVEASRPAVSGTTRPDDEPDLPTESRRSNANAKPGSSVRELNEWW